MKISLSNIVKLQSGVFLKSKPHGDTLYLIGRHFNTDGTFRTATQRELKLDQINPKHLLQDGDILFAAKGHNNYAVVYDASIGDAVASSIFVIIRLKDKNKILPQYLAWFLNQPAIINELLKDVKKSTIPSVNMQQLAKLEINIPDLKSQHIIIHIQQLGDRQKQLLQQIAEHKKLFIQQQLLKATTV